MIEISDTAAIEIEKVLKEKSPEGDKTVRVYAMGYGWGGPTLGMALDEPSDNDEVFDVNGFKVIIEKQLLEKVGGAKIDFETSRWKGAGFRIFATYQAASSCC